MLKIPLTIQFRFKNSKYRSLVSQYHHLDERNGVLVIALRLLADSLRHLANDLRERKGITKERYRTTKERKGTVKERYGLTN